MTENERLLQVAQDNAVLRRIRSELGYRCGQRVERPAVLADDGEPLEVGQTVWHVDGRGPYKVANFKKLWVRVDDSEGNRSGFWPDNLTHQRPVLDAGGVPLEAGQTVWHVDTGHEYVVVEPSYGDTVVVRLAKYDDAEGEQYTPDQLTHTKPEQDSWERIEEDAKKDRCSYFGAKYQDCGRCTQLATSCSISKACDIVHRCKALAGRDAS